MRRTPILVAALLPALASIALASPIADAPSAYVRAHAGSPVKFLPWGEAAWARAKAEQKPIYLVVGAFSQELARAMREQSFAREENAALLNESFVPVVVDRDEHPDLAAFLQAYVGTVKQMQGWPLNVWLTPDLKPFDGASYLPPSDEWGKEGFPNAIKRVLGAWQTDPEAQRAKAEEALATLAAAVPTEPPPAVDATTVNTLLAEATAAWMATYDATNGGFGEPPRRLEPELLRFLVRSEDKNAREAALHTLRAVLTSPVRDPLDGGFFRSAGDTAWRQPTLQKLLSDQARAALAYAEAVRAGGAELLETGATCAFGYSLVRDNNLGVVVPFSGCEDGTAEGAMPAYFWSAGDVDEVAGVGMFALVGPAFGMTEAGNVPADSYLGIDLAGKNLLRFDPWKPVAATDFARFNTAREAMRVARAKRLQSAWDGPATSGAHGLLLAAMGRETPTAGPGVAAGLAALIRRTMIAPDGRLRSAAGYETFASARDYALVADGLLTFAATAKDDAARRAALALLAKADALFWDAAVGRYLAAPATLPTGIGIRVIAPAPDAGDLPSAESAMLLVLAMHQVGDAAHRAALTAAIAADVREAATPARGDQLLALQTWAATLK